MIAVRRLSILIGCMCLLSSCPNDFFDSEAICECEWIASEVSFSCVDLSLGDYDLLGFEGTSFTTLYEPFSLHVLDPEAWVKVAWTSSGVGCSNVVMSANTTIVNPESSYEDIMYLMANRIYVSEALLSSPCTNSKTRGKCEVVLQNVWDFNSSEPVTLSWSYDDVSGGSLFVLMPCFEASPKRVKMMGLRRVYVGGVYRLIE